jgi:digeranylgeranylglycerophospholipid reductase
MTRFDVIVVGAGPVGSYTAYQLADRGFSVCVLEQKRTPGQDIICAGVVSKAAFKRYDLPSTSILSRISSVSFVSPLGRRLEYEPNEIISYVVDRGDFDSKLLRMAKKFGAQVRLKHKVHRITESNSTYTVHTERKQYRARAVVLATGIQYDLSQQSGLSRPQKYLYGAQVEFPYSCKRSHIEIHLGQTFAPGSFGWVIPARTGHARVGTIIHRRGKTYLKKMLTDRLEVSLKNIEPFLRTKRIAYGPVRRSVRGNVLSVGEAAGQIKTTTGGGIFYGFLCSEIAVDKLVKTLKQGRSLQDYEITWRSALISELDIGIRLRKIAEQLSDDDIENLFTFVKKNRFWVELLVPRIDFDYHSNVIFFCIKSFGALLKLPETE